MQYCGMTFKTFDGLTVNIIYIYIYIYIIYIYILLK